MEKVFLVDVAKCNGCYSCQIVCKDEHCGNDWRPYAAPQPDTGQFWLRMDEKVRGSVPLVKMAYTPVLCAHCAECPVLAQFPEAGYRREDGLVILDPEKATDPAIKDACPLGAVYWNDELGIAQKCTGCAHLLDNGWTEPRCVDACPHEAIRFVDADDPAVAGFSAMSAVAEFGAHVLYRNLPKRFVGGAVVDKARDELIIGAPVCVELNGEVVCSGETDYLGDFFFDGLEPACYSVKIAPDGFEPLCLKADAVEVDVNLGDIFFG